MDSTHIDEYNSKQPGELGKICQILRDEITKIIPQAEGKLFHANPTWFIDGNPIVGYDAASDHVNLLFWSGQSFDEPDLIGSGKFKAAGTHYSSVDDVDYDKLRAWLKKSVSIQWDYKNLRANNGILNNISK